MSAWLMAVVLRGMSRAEIAALTEAMLHSGRVLDFSDLPGRKVDKHSTGGVGDKTSLIIAPIVAAGGLNVPMISGRGLGHSGGTLDKLESIPGFNVNLSLAEFRRVLATCGCALIGQTAEIAPADKKIYALRDVTGTVESPALICASIMSKKLAEGIDALVLDVKTGSGAFMKKEEDAVNLAELLVETGKRMGKKVGRADDGHGSAARAKAGNAMEVAESIEVLRGRGPADLRELCLELAAWMFFLGERTPSVEEGRSLAADNDGERAGARRNSGWEYRVAGRRRKRGGRSSILAVAPSHTWMIEVQLPVFLRRRIACEFGLRWRCWAAGEKKEDKMDHGGWAGVPQADRRPR